MFDCDRISPLRPIVSLSVQTRILVTHGLSFLPYADEIVVLLDGEVSEVGSYQSLRASRGAFSEFLDTYAGEQRKSTLSDSGNDALVSHCITDISCTSFCTLVTQPNWVI